MAGHIFHAQPAIDLPYQSNSVIVGLAVHKLRKLFVKPLVFDEFYLSVVNELASVP